MKVILFLVFFFLVGAFFIVANENIALNSSENVGKFFDLYFDWIKGLSENGKSLTGYVVKMSWLPDLE